MYKHWFIYYLVGLKGYIFVYLLLKFYPFFLGTEMNVFFFLFFNIYIYYVIKYLFIIKKKKKHFLNKYVYIYKNGNYS